MNWDTLAKTLLVAAKLGGSIGIICLVAQFISWKAIRDYETEKKRAQEVVNLSLLRRKVLYDRKGRTY